MATKQRQLTEMEVVRKVQKVAGRYGFSTFNLGDLLLFAEKAVEEFEAGRMTRTDLHQYVVGICMAANRRSLSKVEGPHIYPTNYLADAFMQANTNVL